MIPVWPSKNDPIVEVSYDLVTGFNDKGEPVYRRGVDRNADVMRTLQTILESLQLSPASIASVTMGSVEIHLGSGATVTLRPVFHPSADEYGGLIKVDHNDVPMPEELADILNRWRKELVAGNKE